MILSRVMHSLLVAAAIAVALCPVPVAGAGEESCELPSRAVVVPEGPGSLRVEWEGQTIVTIRLDLLPSRGKGEKIGGDAAPISLDPESSQIVDAAPSPLSNRPTQVAGLRILERSGTIVPLGAVLRCEWYHWPYFQMDDFVVWNLSLLGVGARPLQLFWQPASTPPSGGRIQGGIFEAEFEMHGPDREGRMGKARIPWIRVEDAQGRRLYLGLIDLSGRARLEEAPREEGGGCIEILPAPRGPQNGLFVLVSSSSEASFLYNGGQALRMVADLPKVEGSPWIATRHQGSVVPRVELPPLCYLCRSASVKSSQVRLSQNLSRNELVVDLSVGGISGHGMLDGEAFRWSGHPMAPWWRGGGDHEARFLVPLDFPLAQEIVQEAASGNHGLTLPLNTGIEIEVQPAYELDPGLRGSFAPAASKSSKLPSKLNPELLEAWPNPFQDRTTIRLKIPTTMGESFFFPEGPPQGFNFSAPAPFGRAPAVQIVVYNVGGKVVRTLLQRASVQGSIQVDWDGKDLMGRPVVAGAYYLDVQIGEYHLSRRILRLRS